MEGLLMYIFVYLGGIKMMEGILPLSGIFISTFQNYVPKGKEGRFQVVIKCFMILIPMIVGPIISIILGLNAMGLKGENFILFSIHLNFQLILRSLYLFLRYY
jgi:hypothetical protein